MIAEQNITLGCGAILVESIGQYLKPEECSLELEDFEYLDLLTEISLKDMEVFVLALPLSSVYPEIGWRSVRLTMTDLPAEQAN